MSNPESSWEKRKAQMKKRLEGLTKNPVVAAAIKNQEPPESDKKWEQWRIVSELVDGARTQFFKDGNDMKSTLRNLAVALNDLSKKPMPKVSGSKSEVYTDYDD